MRKNNGHIEILIAEDSPTQAELLRQLLEAHHYKVSMAPNGRAALAHLAQHQAALVISDVMMPELDGYGLCKAIKADETLKHIPVILVTTLSDPDDVIRGLECGADNFIRKPYEEKYLLSRIDYLLMNVELRKNQRMQMALEIKLGGKRHVINAERQQILDLLVSTFEQAVHVNSELKEREQELAHSNHVLRGLNRIAEGLNNAVSQREVAETALQRALELPGIHAGWVSLRTGENSFSIAAACCLPPALSGPEAFDGDCACRRLLLNGELANGTNIIRCERLAKAEGDTLGLCCHASIPLWLGEGRALGVMNLAGPGNHLFSEAELQVLHNVGNQVAVALERAQLHDHLETLVAERTAKLASEIEERKRIEQKEARLASIIEATPDFVGSVDLAGRPIFINRAGLKMLGYDPEHSALPAHLAEVHPEWAAKRIIEEAIPHAAAHGSWSGETVLLRQDGTIVHVSQVIIAHRGDDGAVAFFSTIMRDITERKRTEDALRASEARLRAIIEAEPECVKILDAEGRIVQMNAAGLAMIGANDFTQVEGCKVIEFVPPAQHDAYCAFANEVLHGGGGSFEFEITSFNGTHLWLDTHAVLLHEQQDERPLILAVTRDITERKQAEAALLQLNESLEQRVLARTSDLERSRREADDANEAKSAFLSTMSHEIRTPMNGVIGMVDVLAQSQLSEHQSELVNTIRDSANSLLGIIDDILDFSKIEAGRLRFERMPVAVADLVEGLCNSLAPVAAIKGVDLFMFISPDIPERVWGDEMRLRQVLNNLVGNAIKFSKGTFDKRGRVSIRVEVAQAAPLRLTLRVIDNGIGMAPETLNSLFTPFTQAEVSTTRRFGGTGLGLAITKRLVDLLQGEITVASTPGVGSTFTVTMPFEALADQQAHPQPDLSGLDCIILESPDIHADDLRAYLAHAGAQVALVNDAADAARVATQLGETVVVILEAEFGTEPAVAQALFATLPNVRRLLITRGRRRCARVYSDTTITLDGDGLRRLALLRAVAVAADRASPEIFHAGFEEPRVSGGSAPTIAEARAQGRLILVAEDDEINQKVILTQLDLLGHAAEIAGNGAEALRLWRDRDYALLLTDLHMPEMDGYTLAKTIRREECGAVRIPILALTANALRGEASHALASGMDEYLTKPILLAQLKSALEKWLPRAADSALPAGRAEEVKQGQRGGAVDVDVLKGMVGDDPDMVREFLADYLASAQSQAHELDAALAAGDLRHIGAIAHKLKSSSRSVGALVLGDMCADLENFGKTGDKDGVAQGMDKFHAALADVEMEIARLLTG